MVYSFLNERPRRKQRGITHVIDFINAASGWEYTPSDLSVALK